MTRPIYSRIYLSWTPARQAWLERLEGGPAVRNDTLVGYQCMRIGWTDWAKNGMRGDFCLERITPSGREALAQWRAERRAHEARPETGAERIPVEAPFARG